MSTATDMAKWVKFNLQMGKTEAGDQLIDRKLMEEMHWPTAGYDSPDVLADRFFTKPQYPVDEIQIGYGYGWALSVYRGAFSSYKYSQLIIRQSPKPDVATFLS